MEPDAAPEARSARRLYGRVAGGAYLAIVLAAWITLGTLVYSLNEGWGVVESFYFSVMTLTTIGYGDFSPTDSAMQIYTVVYAVLGIGFFVSFNARLVQIAIETRRHDKKLTADSEN